MICDDDEKGGLFRNRTLYSLPTRIDPWLNNLAIEESKRNQTAYKKAHCQLLVAKTRSMLRNVLQPVNLVTAIENIFYDDYYQIVASEFSNPLDTSNPVKGLYLSGLMDERDIDQGIGFMHGCKLTASSQKTPCKRNCFRFVSAENKSGSLNYGEDIFIQIYSSEDEQPLYVQAEYTTIDTFGDHMYARLSMSPDVYCHFKLLHKHPAMRKISLGGNVLPNSNLIIQHVSSGRNLALEITKWIPTFFGAECIVSCHTYQNVNRVETAENMWKIVGKRELDKGMMTRAAKGENIPAELLE